MRYALFSIFVIASAMLHAQNLMKAGPMNGYSEMREAAVWVQMNEACEVQLEYWADTLPSVRMRTAPIQAVAEKAFTAHLVATQVEPGGRYGYRILAGEKDQTAGRELYFTTQPLWQFRSDPPPFRIAAGSCAYINEHPYDRPGRKYGTNFDIFERIADARPDIMLWLGDNIYLREVDWFTKSGYAKRYSHMRSTPELQRLLSSTHHYAIWDDHDYGPNDANRAFPHKDTALETFKMFWANNGYGAAGLQGITGTFQFHDIDFFLLDNRWNRTDPNLVTTREQVFGNEQIDWLIECMKYSKAPFKIVVTGGQILNDAKVWENYANYEDERALLLDRIAAEGIRGVVFLTGDRHHAELIKVEHKGVVMYDFTTSPLTSGTHKAGDEATTNRVNGTLYLKHNFALIDVSGSRNERQLNLRLMDENGSEVWSRVIKASEWTDH